MRQKNTGSLTFCQTACQIGAVDRNRTDTGSPPTDFESVASASFTTTALNKEIIVQLKRKIKRFFLDSCKKNSAVVQYLYGKTYLD